MKPSLMLPLRKAFLVSLLILLLAPASQATPIPALSPSPSDAPAPSDVGEKQLLRVLADRPQLQSLVVPGSPIWTWLAAAFADRADGVHVQWRNVPTSSFNPSSAESSASPDADNNLYVIVDGNYKSGSRQGQPRTAEEVLSTLVFELINVQSYKDKMVLRSAMRAGTIPRQDFILGAARLEFRANQKTKEFYHTIFVPYCQQRGLDTHAGLWFGQFPDDFPSQIALYPRNYWYPWKYFGDMYDWAASQRAAFVELYAGKYDQAIADLTKSINYSAEIYYWRGVAELAKGDMDHSLADFSHIDTVPQCDNSTRDESALLAWSILASRGLKAEADRRLNDRFTSRLAQPEKNDWPALIALFLLDRTSEKDFLAEAANLQHVVNYDQVCVAWYYVAAKHDLTQDHAAVHADFQECVTTGDNHVAEFLIASARLNSRGTEL